MKIPATLKHKPVIVSENYENVDGRYAYKTDYTKELEVLRDLWINQVKESEVI